MPIYSKLHPLHDPLPSTVPSYQVIVKCKKQFEETEQVSKPDMAGTVKWSDREFKITLINMLRALLGNVDNMQEQMENV